MIFASYIVTLSTGCEEKIPYDFRLLSRMLWWRTTVQIALGARACNLTSVSSPYLRKSYEPTMWIDCHMFE